MKKLVLLASGLSFLITCVAHAERTTSDEKTETKQPTTMHHKDEASQDNAKDAAKTLEKFSIKKADDKKDEAKNRPYMAQAKNIFNDIKDGLDVSYILNNSLCLVNVNQVESLILNSKSLIQELKKGETAKKSDVTKAIKILDDVVLALKDLLKAHDILAKAVLTNYKRPTAPKEAQNVNVIRIVQNINDIDLAALNDIKERCMHSQILKKPGSDIKMFIDKVTTAQQALNVLMSSVTIYVLERISGMLVGAISSTKVSTSSSLIRKQSTSTVLESDDSESKSEKDKSKKEDDVKPDSKKSEDDKKDDVKPHAKKDDKDEKSEKKDDESKKPDDDKKDDVKPDSKKDDKDEKSEKKGDKSKKSDDDKKDDVKPDSKKDDKDEKSEKKDDVKSDSKKDDKDEKSEKKDDVKPDSEKDDKDEKSKKKDDVKPDSKKDDKDEKSEKKDDVKPDSEKDDKDEKSKKKDDVKPDSKKDDKDEKSEKKDDVKSDSNKDDKDEKSEKKDDVKPDSEKDDKDEKSEKKDDKSKKSDDDKKDDVKPDSKKDDDSKKSDDEKKDDVKPDSKKDDDSEKSDDEKTKSDSKDDKDSEAKSEDKESENANDSKSEQGDGEEISLVRITNIQEYLRAMRHNLGLITVNETTQKKFDQALENLESNERNYEQHYNDLDAITKLYNTTVSKKGAKTKKGKNLTSVPKTHLRAVQEGIYIDIFEDIDSKYEELSDNDKLKDLLEIQNDITVAKDKNEKNKESFKKSSSWKEKRDLLSNSSKTYDDTVKKISEKKSTWRKNKGEDPDLKEIGYTLDSIILKIQSTNQK